jgi:hypothetical protein
MVLPVLHAILVNLEVLMVLFAHAWLDIMKCIMTIKAELARNAIPNVLPAQSVLLLAHHVIPRKTEYLEWMITDIKLVFVNPDITQLVMEAAFKATVMPILSVVNASKDLNFAFSVLPQGTESFNFLKAFADAWMATMKMPPKIVFLAPLDVESVNQPPIVPLVLLLPPPTETELAAVLHALSSLSLPMV